MTPHNRSPTFLPWLLLLPSLLVSGAYLYFLAGSGDRFNDFSVFWAAALDLRQHSLAQVYDATAFQQFLQARFTLPPLPHPFVYPPCTALLFAPFGLLPFRGSLLLWNGLSLALYLAGLRQAAGPFTPRSLLAAIAPATAACLLFGQTGLLIGGLALLGLGWLERRPLLSGAVLGLLVLKPQMLLPFLLILAALGRYRTAAAAVAAALALCMLSLLCFGFDAWAAWLAQLHEFSGDVSQSAAHRLYGVSVYFALLDLGAGARLALCAQLAALAAVLWSLRGAARRGWSGSVLIACLVGSFLMTSYAVLYDLPAVAAACLMLAEAGRRSGFRDGELAAIAAAWCLPLLLFLPGPWTAPAAALVLAALLLLILRRGAAPASSGEAEAGAA